MLDAALLALLRSLLARISRNFVFYPMKDL